MTENEAIKEIEVSLELAKMCTPNREREKEIKAYKMAIQALEKVQQFEAIGTVEEFKDLKEKNEPEKPLFVPTDDTCLYQEYRCPSCNEWLADKFKPYRCKCGQKLDWE